MGLEGYSIAQFKKGGRLLENRQALVFKCVCYTEGLSG